MLTQYHKILSALEEPYKQWIKFHPYIYWYFVYIYLYFVTKNSFSSWLCTILVKKAWYSITDAMFPFYRGNIFKILFLSHCNSKMIIVIINLSVFACDLLCLITIKVLEITNDGKMYMICMKCSDYNLTLYNIVRLELISLY